MLAPFLVLFIFKVVFSRWSPQGNLVEVELEPLEMGTLVDDVYVEIDFIHSSTFSEITQLTFVNVGEILSLSLPPYQVQILMIVVKPVMKAKRQAREVKAMFYQRNYQSDKSS
ncbi:unnamed protein product [Candida parapsilosis]